MDGRRSGGESIPAAQQRGTIRVVGAPAVGDSVRGDAEVLRRTNRDVAAAATVAQLVETGLETAHQTLAELYRLAVRAQQPLTDAEQQQVFQQVGRLREELAELAQSVRFNGIPLLNGAQRSLTFQVGGRSEAVEVHLGLMDVRPQTLLPGVEAIAFATARDAQSAAAMIRDAMGAVHERVEKVRAFRERLELAVERTAPAPEADQVVQTPEEAQQLLAMARSQILSAPARTVPLQAAALSTSAMELLTP